MSKEEKERRCKSCGKLLLDEKVPFCRRCILEGRNKAVKVGGLISGLAITAGNGIALINNNSDSNDDTTS